MQGELDWRRDMSRWCLIMSLVIVVVSAAVSSALAPGDTLDIYWVDVEGGAATLIVTPARESILMDSGWGRSDERDAIRIQEAMMDANIERLDYFIASHFHRDHVGGLPALARRVEIGHFLDHGDSIEQDQERSKEAWDAYLQAALENRRTVKAGDQLPLQGVDFTFVAVDGETWNAQEQMKTNSHCVGASPGVRDIGDEDSRSVGYLLSFGEFQFVNLGDLTIDVQHKLACPENKLGVVDLYQIPYHGDVVAPQLVWALNPTVAIINNGPHKGGSADGFEVVAQTPEIEDIWQVHRALDSDAAHNTNEHLTANLTHEDQCSGHWIKMEVNSGGDSYSVSNRRTRDSRSYFSK